MIKNVDCQLISTFARIIVQLEEIWKEANVRFLLSLIYYVLNVLLMISVSYLVSRRV